MIPKAAIPRLGSWLVGPFLIAQVCAVVPLLSDHTSHLAETQLVLSKHNGAAGSARHGRHYQGDVDRAIQHHELQVLDGVLMCLFGGCEPSFAHVTVTAYVPGSLTEGRPALLERPPKSSLSIRVGVSGRSGRVLPFGSEDDEA